MRVKYYVLTGAALSAVSVPASAQVDPAVPVEATTDAAPADDEPGEIIVTARQREESLKDIPVAVTALSGDMLREQQILAVKDIAAISPGLVINSDSVSRAFVSIRGVGTTLIDTVQPGVGIFIDGIYQPNTSYLNSPLADIERVEVLRCPQGTLFGNNTLGGAINVITRKPGNDFEARVDGAYAPVDDYISSSMSVSGPAIPDLLAVRVGAAYHTRDGFQRNLLAGGFSNPLEQLTVGGTARLTPSRNVRITLNANRDRVRGGNTPYFNVAGPRDYTLDGRTNQNSIATITYHGVNLKGELDIESIGTTVTLVGAYNQRDLRSSNDADFSPIDLFRSAVRSKLRTKTGELRFDTKLSDSISTLIGAFASRSTTDTSGTTLVVPAGLRVPNAGFAESNFEAIFGTVFLSLGAGLEITAGLRYDRQKLDATSASTAEEYEAEEWQPRFTVAKRWNRDFMTYASVARGVRGGGQNGPGAPNLIYDGDSVWTYEVGAKLSALDDRLSFDVAGFYNDYSDFIGQNALAPRTNGAGFVAINLNTGDVESYGVEAELRWRITDQWRVFGGATLLHARITNDDNFFRLTGTRVSNDRLIFTPDWTFNVGSNYTVPIGAGALEFNGLVTGTGSRPGSSLDPNFSPILEKYMLVNGSIGYKTGGVEIAAFATNLLNEKYMESYIDRSLLVRAGLPGPIQQNLGIQGNRRRIGVRLSTRF